MKAVQRIGRPHTEPRLDLHGVACLHELEEVTERADIVPARRRADTLVDQCRDDGSTSLAVSSHAGLPANAKKRSSTPVPLSIVTWLKPRATWLATKPSTHRAWNANGSSVSNGATVTAGVAINRRPCRSDTAHLQNHRQLEANA